MQRLTEIAGGRVEVDTTCWQNLIAPQNACCQYDRADMLGYALCKFPEEAADIFRDLCRGRAKCKRVGLHYVHNNPTALRGVEDEFLLSLVRSALASGDMDFLESTVDLLRLQRPEVEVPLDSSSLGAARFGNGSAPNYGFVQLLSDRRSTPRLRDMELLHVISASARGILAHAVLPCTGASGGVEWRDVALKATRVSSACPFGEMWMASRCASR